LFDDLILVLPISSKARQGRFGFLARFRSSGSTDPRDVAHINVAFIADLDFHAASA
jgi:hypothetical protein